MVDDEMTRRFKHINWGLLVDTVTGHTSHQSSLYFHQQQQKIQYLYLTSLIKQMLLLTKEELRFPDVFASLIHQMCVTTVIVCTSYIMQMKSAVLVSVILLTNLICFKIKGAHVFQEQPGGKPL